MPNLRHSAGVAGLVFLLLAACSPTGTQGPVTAANHPWFPIGEGARHAVGKVTVEGALTCDSCHRPSAPSFQRVRCDVCHKHDATITPRLHLGVTDFAVDVSGTVDADEQAELRGASCYRCHPSGEPQLPFSHTGISSQCAQCHQPNQAFAELPLADGGTHLDYGMADCGGCHTSTVDWKQVTAAPTTFDPQRSVVVNALQPTWVGTVIQSVTPNPQTLPMMMNHGAAGLGAVVSSCATCHAQADQGQYYPGVMHWSLAVAGLPQPPTCVDCHGAAGPTGFVGTRLDTARTPPSGEMKHDAVVWVNDAPTSTPVITAGCEVCHQPPDDNIQDARWAFARGRDDGGIATFHLALVEASLPQPTACLDCHANTRPVTPVMSPTFTFDHGSALGECATCHTSTTTWAGGRYHLAGGPTPTTCLPCHAGDRPTSTAGWTGNFAAKPFDYVTNVNGDTHGADLDCATCHRGPGTGVWGSTQNWVGGSYGHATTSLAGNTCIACHTTQRPDLLSPPADAGYDHAASGTGDCFACHHATVVRGVYDDLYPIPGGDWRGGQSYPGDLLISTPGTSLRIPSTRLNRTGARVTGMTTTNVTLPNAFKHTSAAIPAAVNPGPASSPDQGSCWHCHTSTGTTVTAYANGVFHSALDGYRATPGGPVTPLPQPTTCNDCHAQMRPPDIVAKAGTPAWLQPMDHGALFTGGAVSGVPAMDCGACHGTPGTGPVGWSDGVFHANVPSGATPSECVSCHYPLTTTPTADVTTADFDMKHRAAVVTQQACATCHTTALGRASTTPIAGTLWRTGQYHGAVTAQPTTCNDCHANNEPATATQSTVVYALAQGGTATNGAQWMNHASPHVTGRDCATCHQADARASGAAWSPSTAFHAKVSNVTQCTGCHGTGNGRGTTVGTNNNLPAGLTDTKTVTTSSASPGVRDQIDHREPNVSGKDCRFCHDQVGPSTVPAVQGREWAQADFHRNFTAAQPLQVNGTTSRCATCHFNLRPGSGFAGYNHTALSQTTGQDCSSCHSWPGTSPTTPNWLGATGAHAASGPTAGSTLDCNTCHGQNGSSSTRLNVPASSHYRGVSNGNTCTSCHVNFAGFGGTTANLKYGHTNAAANSGGCEGCHGFVGQLYTTLTTTPPLTFPTAPGGHQFSQSQSVTGRVSNDTGPPRGSFTSTHTNAGLARCSSCHQYASTTATTNVWAFKHRTNNPGISQSRSTTGCTMCH